MTVRNGGAETLTINNASIVNPDGTNQYLTDSSSESVDIGVGNSESITLDTGYGISSSDGCNDFELEFNYTMGELSDQVSQGTLTDSVEFTGDDVTN
jgi:hypothetical protein